MSQPPTPPVGDQPPIQPQGDQPAFQPQPEQPDPYAPRPVAKPKRSLVQMIFSGVVVAAVIIGAIVYFWNKMAEEQLLQVGNCVVLSGESNNPKITEAKCDDSSKASWEIVLVKKDGSECDANEFAEYYVTKGSKRIASYCMVENLFPNVCYTAGNTPQELAVIGCTDPNAKVKVTQRINEANATCGANEEALSYPTAKRTYCLGAPA